MNPSLPPATDPVIRVLCVDDNTDMNAALQLTIESQPHMQCVGCLTSADRLLATIRDMPLPPNVVILDATMPGKGPLLVLSKLAEAHPGSRVIVCSGHDGPAIVQQAKDAGAWGFVSKRHDPDRLMLAVREVAAGRPFWPAPVHPHTDDAVTRGE